MCKVCSKNFENQRRDHLTNSVKHMLFVLNLQRWVEARMTQRMGTCKERACEKLKKPLKYYTVGAQTNLLTY